MQKNTLEQGKCEEKEVAAKSCYGLTPYLTFLIALLPPEKQDHVRGAKLSLGKSEEEVIV